MIILYCVFLNLAHIAPHQTRARCHMENGRPASEGDYSDVSASTPLSRDVVAAGRRDNWRGGGADVESSPDSLPGALSAVRLPLVARRGASDDHLPKDHYYLVYIVFFLQGVGMLFPWSEWPSTRTQSSRARACAAASFNVRRGRFSFLFLSLCSFSFGPLSAALLPWHRGASRVSPPDPPTDPPPARAPSSSSPPLRLHANNHNLKSLTHPLKHNYPASAHPNMLLPPHADVFITAALYFHTRLKGTPFENNFENVFSFSYSLANLGCMAVAVRYGHLPIFNMRSTVAVPQIVTATIFAATTALVLDDSIGGNNLFYITTAFVLVAGATAALIQAGIFGLAGRFPSVYTQAVMSGQGVAGMTVSIISLASSLAGKCGGASASPTWKQIQPASFTYFLSSTVVILLTLLAFVLLTRSDFAQHYAFSDGAASDGHGFYEYDDEELCDPADGRDSEALAEAMDAAMLTPRTRRRIIERRRSIMAAPVFQSPSSSASSSRRSTPGTHTPRDTKAGGALTARLGDGSGASSSHRRGVSDGSSSNSNRPPLSPTLAASPGHLNGIRGLTGEAVMSSIAEGATYGTLSGGGTEDADAANERRMASCDVISLILRHCFSVCLVFLVTLSVFPGITSQIRSSQNLDNVRCPKAGRFFGAGVWQAIFFLLFNAGDTVGRLLAAARQCVPKRMVFLLSVSRLAFVPLFLLCNVVATTPSIHPVPQPNGTSLSVSAVVLSAAGVSMSTAAPPVLVAPSYYYVAMGGGSERGGLLAAGTDPRLGYFQHDAYPILFMLLLSVSNGYVASLEMMNAPSVVPDGQQSRAGTIMAFFLVMGIFLGSVMSFPVRAVACQCDPFLG